MHAHLGSSSAVQSPCGLEPGLEHGSQLALELGLCPNLASVLTQVKISKACLKCRGADDTAAAHRIGPHTLRYQQWQKDHPTCGDCGQSFPDGNLIEVQHLG